MPRCNSSDFNPCGCLAVPGLGQGALQGLTKSRPSMRADAVPERNGSMAHFNRTEKVHWRWLLPLGLGCRDAHLIKLFVLRTSPS
jgi:hypothetical protein